MTPKRYSQFVQKLESVNKDSKRRNAIARLSALLLFLAAGIFALLAGCLPAQFLLRSTPTVSAQSSTSMISVPYGFCTETFYSGSPLAHPKDLLFGPDGRLIVSDNGPVIGDCGTEDGAVFAISPDRSVATLVSGQGLQEPVGIAYGPGSNGWTTNLYIADQNSVGCRGQVFRLDNGSATPIYTGAPWETVGDPTRLAFGPGGAWGTDLYVVDPSSNDQGPGLTGGIYRLSPTGQQTNFVYGSPLIDPFDLAFGPGGAFGTNLYVLDYNYYSQDKYIWAIDPAGNISQFAGGSGSPFRFPTKLAFGPGGIFGTDLYVLDTGAGAIFKVNAAGSFSTFVSGLATATSSVAGMAFSPAGDALYVVNGSDIIRITQSGGTGLVSYWPADGNALDVIGGNNGTLQGQATFSPGKGGQAFSFPNTSTIDYVQAPTAGLPIGNSDRTLMLWVYGNSYPAAGTRPESFFAGYGNFGYFNQTYQLGTAGNTLYFSQWGQSISGPQLQPGVWYHVAVTNQGNNVTLYLNGQIVASGTLPIDTPSGSQFYIGRVPLYLDGVPRILQGLVDEVKIYNRALSAAEIQSQYAPCNATFSININPGAYTGQYFLFNPSLNSYTGPTTVQLAPGTYFLDSGSNIGPSQFTFTVDSTGQVTNISNPVAAHASGNTLFLNNTTVVINPGNFAGRYFAVPYLPTSFTGQQSVVVVPGLACRVDDGSLIGNSDFYFIADSNGQITSISNPSAAQASGNTLTFNTVLVHVDPTTYTGVYSVAGYLNLSGQTSITLIPSLAANVTAGSQGAVTPGSTQVSPSSLVLTSGGQTYTFNFFIVPPDTTPPVINCLANVVASNDPNLCSARVSPGTATATDNVDGAVTPVGVRSDGRALSDPYPIGITTITWTATDKAGNSASCAQTITVANNPPAAGAGGPYTVNEGGSVVVSATGSDPEGGAVSFAWDLGSGSFNTSGQSATFSAAGLDGPGTRTIRVRVTDACGAATIASATVNILNVAPTVGAIIAPVDPQQVNTAVPVSASFTDPGVLDSHTAAWNWGDGSTSASAVMEMNGSGSVSGSHTYTAAGVYTLSLTVTDKDGASGQAVFQYVVVYDPSAGFVTGGGWINSPAGAYVPTPSLSGKATFGFVSKYEKGASVPSGSTQFIFHVTGMNFQSTSYDWLVIAGAKAQYKGSGTINGSGSYGFLLTAIDGQVNGGGGVDKFRIKIWDKTTGQVIYDNQVGADDNADPTTSVAGGSIVIHSN